MMQRISDHTRESERSQQMQLAAREFMLLMVDAETGQRGFLLTGRADYLAIHDAAQDQLPASGDLLSSLALTPEETERVDALRELKRQRLDVMEQTIVLARQGRIGEAVQILRGGEGKALMDEMREQVTAIDRLEEARVEASNRAARNATWAAIGVNGVSAILIIALAVISLMLIRRYVGEVQSARDSLDELNRGLEATVARPHRRPDPRQRRNPALRLHRQPRPARAAGQRHGLHLRAGAGGQGSVRPHGAHALETTPIPSSRTRFRPCARMCPRPSASSAPRPPRWIG